MTSRGTQQATPGPGERAARSSRPLRTGSSFKGRFQGDAFSGLNRGERASSFRKSALLTRESRLQWEREVQQQLGLIPPRFESYDDFIWRLDEKDRESARDEHNVDMKRPRGIELPEIGP